MNYSRSKREMSAAAVLALMLVCITAIAQSGRRVRKATTQPEPTPEASLTPTPKKSPERPATPVFVATNSHDTNANIPLYFGDSIGKSCAQRLGKKLSLTVELSSRDMSRGEAIKRAKEAKSGFVALLELRSDRMRMNNSRDTDLGQLYIEYSLFAAVSGKPITSGSVYQQAGLRDVIAGRGNSTNAVEYRLQTAAQVAAERILAAMSEP